MNGTINNGDVAFMVITTVLVFFMTPGLAFFYGGLVERKNALTMMRYTFVAIGIVTVMWVLGGFSMVFGDDAAGFIGNPMHYFMLNNVDFTINPNYGSKIPFLMFFMYQLMFAIITAPLMTGAFANRMTLGGWIKVLILWMILIYFPVAHWVWGQGFLSHWGFVDYAGGTVIHVAAGFSALASVFYFGKRAFISKSGPGNTVWMAIGASILLFGWFGFNSGGALTGGETAAIAFTNTGIAGGFAATVWMFLAYMRDKKFSMVEFMTGAVAGLATITPCSGYVTPQGAVIVGIFAPCICFLCLTLTKKMRWDDALGVWGVHGMGGLTGTILIGVLAAEEVNGIAASGKQLLVQTGGALLVAVYAFVLTYLILKLCNAAGSIRVPAEVQEKGLDTTYTTESVE
ncbi:MAG: ammonium transporter [Bacteroidales bacterium]